MTLEELRTKRVGIAGLGQEGQAVFKYLTAAGITPIIFEQKPREQWEMNAQTLVAGALQISITMLSGWSIVIDNCSVGN